MDHKNVTKMSHVKSQRFGMLHRWTFAIAGTQIVDGSIPAFYVKKIPTNDCSLK